MKKIIVTDTIRQACHEFKGITISCEVKNSEPDAALWQEIDALSAQIVKTLSVEQINKRPAILATRQAYKALGKEPNRYRPSAEALCRRIVKEGKELYRINTLVDLINLVSISSGFSIGGFDQDKIQGDTLTMGAGEADEIFHGIGRGLLNIQFLPVYRDSFGGIGTPTSDEERTKLTLSTTSLLMIINGFSGQENLMETAQWSVQLIKKYAQGSNFELLEF